MRQDSLFIGSLTFWSNDRSQATNQQTIQKETREQKLLVFVSNGEEITRCDVDAPTKDRFELADEIRRMGVYIICPYLQIPNLDEVVRITGTTELTRPLSFRVSFKIELLHPAMVTGLCNETDSNTCSVC
ncbi:hypothetical protein COOONC_12529 [Cooperia oncophora]